MAKRGDELGMVPAFPTSYEYCDGWVRTGSVTAVGPGAITVRIRGVAPGSLVSITTQSGAMCLAEAQTVRDTEALCAPLERVRDVTVAARATATNAVLGSFCGFGMLGRCVDAWGRPAPAACTTVSRHAPLPLQRRRPVERRLSTGVAAIDALCTLGVGQRVALFSGAGVGKSTLLRQIAEHVQLDAHVVALIGERGREAAEAVAALKDSPRWPTTTLVCATAEAPPQERLAAARTAIAQAEWLCERGCDVLLTFDSLTRIAQAWREQALTAGEPAAHRGHPPSMVSMLAAMVERSGARDRGSITGIFSVLVDADDPFEPVTDAVRGLLDGHIVLSRRLADGGRYPPIDVLRSSSRLMNQIASARHRDDAAVVRRALAALERAEDLFAIGAYVAGGDAVLDAAVLQRQRIEGWLFHGCDASQDATIELGKIAALLRA